MRIDSIYIKNLNSLQLETKIDFQAKPLRNAGLFAITGDTGAGKTTILDALTLALYGKIARVKQARPGKQLLEVMSYGTAESWSEVEFSVNQEVYRAKWNLRRARGKVDGNILDPKRELSQLDTESGEFKILATKIKEVDQLVESITGLDYERFKRSVLLAQGDFAAFLNADERERSELLERITGTDIYTELSIAAFQKYKLENTKWQQQEEELERLDILDNDALSELKKEQENLNKEIQDSQKQLDFLRTAKGYWEQSFQLKNRKKILDEENKTWVLNFSKAQNDTKRLAAHQALEPFAESLHKLENFTNEQKQLLTQASQAQEVIHKMQATKTKQQADFKLVTEALNKHQKTFKQEQALFEKVMLLDKEIEIQTQELKGPSENLAKRQAALSQIEENLQTDNRQLKQQQEEADFIEERLKTRQDDAQLIGINASLEQAYKNWLVLKQDALQRQQKANDSQKQLRGLVELANQADKNLEKAKKAFDTTSQSFKDTLPSQLPNDRAAILDEVNKSLHQLKEQHYQLEELYRLAQEYQQLLNRQNDTLSKLKELQQEEEELNKKMLSLIDRKELIDQELQKRFKLYEQQQRIANYAKDRQELVEGDPCPLCFSTDHPFREMELTPYVDETKKDYERVKQQAEELQKELIDLISHQREINSLIKNIQGKQDESRDSQINILNQEIYQLELSIAKVQHNVSLSTGNQPGLKDLRKALKESLANIANYEKRQQALHKLYQQLIQQEKDVIQLEKKARDAQASVQGLKELWQSQEAYHQEAIKRKEEAQLSLYSILEEWGMKPDPQNLVNNIEQLKKRANTYQELLERKQATATKLTALINLVKGRQENYETLAQQQKELSAQVTKAKASLIDLRNDRQKLFGDQLVTEKRNQLEIQGQELEKKVNHLRDNLQLIQEQLSAKEQVNQDRQQRLEKIATSVEQLKADLANQLTPIGFSDLNTALRARISPAELQVLSQRQNDLQAKKAEISRLLSEWEKEKEQLASKLEDLASYELIIEQLGQIEQNLQSWQQQIGAIQEKLSQNDRRRQQSKKLVVQIEKQKKESLRWAKLNEIIGQADGKKFRSFAQGLTLRKLCYLANRYLQKLHGRYLIHKVEEEDLSLEIIDTYQADNHRPLSTLSGGESFLVSLALALGLSDLAGRKTQIHSLFIDEGFGTLDENSLDLAINTLENLQAVGKTIGIISHVKALKERITTQIKVEKGAGGRSWLEIV